MDWSLRVDAWNDDGKPHLVNHRDDGEITTMALWQVLLNYKNVSYMYHVLAHDADGAIAQVANIPMGDGPDVSCIDGMEALNDGTMTGTATRIPMYIRGWSHTEF